MSTPGWSGVGVLQIAHRLNEQCIAALAEAAASQTAAMDSNPLAGLSSILAQLEIQARRRAARCPVLLVDLNFGRADWWARVAQGEPSSGTSLLPGGVLPVEVARELLRDVLIEAWSAARSLPLAVSLVFGMAPAVCARIAALNISAIDRIVLAHASELRPRWFDNLNFWQTLLEASIAADEERLADLHLYSLQLLAGHLIPQRHEIFSTIHGTSLS